MPAKGVSTRLNPVRLQTIPHLRIRRPNQHEQNSCVTVMSSMLSMFEHLGWGYGIQAGRDAMGLVCESGKLTATMDRLLGFYWV